MKSWYMIVLVSTGLVISSITLSLKFDANEHPCFVAILTSSSMISDIIGLTPIFSSKSAWLGVSKRTLSGWNATGLGHKLARVQAAGYTKTYPIIRSYCCWRMFGDTLQLTWPVNKVIAKASAISFCIEAGIDGFLFAAPTQISVDSMCSNSLGPNCCNSAPDTNDSTTFVGNLSSRWASIPSELVVLTSIHVCCGVTTDSMIPAKSYTSGNAFTQRRT